MEFLGINIGKPLYFNSPTSTMRASSFARICIEMKRSLYVLLDRRREQVKVVLVLWKPPRCTNCETFGHSTAERPLSSAMSSGAKQE